LVFNDRIPPRMSIGFVSFYPHCRRLPLFPVGSWRCPGKLSAPPSSSPPCCSPRFLFFTPQSTYYFKPHGGVGGSLPKATRDVQSSSSPDLCFFFFFFFLSLEQLGRVRLATFLGTNCPFFLLPAGHSDKGSHPTTKKVEELSLCHPVLFFLFLFT